MIKEAIEKLVEEQDLTYDEVLAVMDEIMSGETSQVLISSYLTALRMKGETIEEITASAVGMKKAGRVLEHDTDVLEIVGTGGDKANTFNVSTTAAFVIAAAGCKVAKHGNRGVSSKSGAADVLEALGANISLEPEQSTKILNEVGFCFLFAQKYHTSMKYVGPVRAELGIRTVFNILGPLTNPASATLNVIGVYEENLVEPIAQVLIKLGTKKGMVVFGEDTMDEITPSAKTKVCEIRNGETKVYEINPEDYGITMCKKSDLEGGDAKVNAQILKNILGGEKGSKRDAVILNAAAGIYVTKDDVTYAQAIDLAKEAIDSGAALKKMNEFVEMTNSFDE